jgi:CRP-like cAMP-binding protein
VSPRQRSGSVKSARRAKSNGLSGNKLLAALPAGEYLRLQPMLSIVPLTLGQVLEGIGARSRFVYFPAGGLCSMVAVMEDGRMAEVAAVGNEGMIGVHAFFGMASSSCDTVVQVPGAYAYAMAARIFEREMQRHGPFYDLVSRYVQALVGFLIQSAACNGLHTADQRCARWLLQSHDRVGKDTFRLTQELLAVMLGVRRATVTMIAQQLQKAGLIVLQRRVVTILDRAGLEGVTCECYAVARAHLDRMLE